MLDLFTAHRGRLVNYAYRIVGDMAHAEDVVQEAYLRLDAAAAEQSLGDPAAYLYRIVRNLSLDIRRRINRERDRMVDDGDDAIGQIEADSPSPETEAGDRADLRIIAETIAALPLRSRTALEMHRFGGCTFREIADHLGISVGRAHSLVIEALEHCRQRLYGK
ncbi:sigma-70 family RNA polymerase sigma factor [Lacibacterium aquatile]|uniref:Sigma-70 family RNA polymerase sigma factor n=1 Tax=Lacibacterium aquatile TaxID=1168082 RepID=A0ABW5DPC8_9PROT